MDQKKALNCCLVLMVCLLLSATGCRNRGPFLANNSFGPLRGPTTVAPPNTYALQIPGQNNINQGSGLRQANNVVPTDPNNVNVRNGWQPAGSSSNTNVAPVNGQPAASGTSSNSTLINQTRITSVAPRSPNTNVQPQTRVAQNTSNNGLSFTDATNFRTTAVDERLDQTRLPVTDASQVRAPTTFSPSTTVGQFNQPYYVPNRQPVNNVVPQYQNTQQRFATNPQFPQPQYVNPNLAQNQNGATVVGAFGQPNFARPTQQIYYGSNQNQVLAQSTVYADPANNQNLQRGWTDRELTASRDSLNR